MIEAAAHALASLGLVALAESNKDQAQHYFRESLIFPEGAGRPLEVPPALVGLAGVCLAQGHAEHGEIVVMVADTGPGIPPAEIPSLFEKYKRASGARRSEGMGLGLFIVKTLAEAHDGRIEVESTPGSGARFRVYLPLKAF